MEKMCVSKAFLIGLLIITIYTSAADIDRVPAFFPSASAQPQVTIEARMSEDILHQKLADKAIYYIQKGSDENLLFIAHSEPGTELSYLGENPFPMGFEISSFGGSSDPTIRIHVDPDRIGIPDDQLPVGYGIVFNSTLPSDDPSLNVSTYAETVFIIEPSAVRPSSVISFDKPVYSYEPSSGNPLDIIVNVVDPHVDCNNIDPPSIDGPLNAIPASAGAANLNFLDPNHPLWIRVSVWFDGEDENSYFLPRDPYGNDAFRGTISLMLNDNVRTALLEQKTTKLNVRYDAYDNTVDTRSPEELCIIPHDYREQEMPETFASVIVSEISFDRLTYSVNDPLGETDSAIIRVRAAATGDIVQARIVSDVAPGALSFDLRRNAAGGDTFFRTIRLTETELTSVPMDPSDPVILNVATDPGASRPLTLTAQYDQISPNPNEPAVTGIATASVLPVRKLAFDDHRTSYFANELAQLILMDPGSNNDANEFEIHYATICSYSYPQDTSASYDFLQKTNIQMAEDTRNSGKFVSSYYIKFTNNTYMDPEYLQRNNLHHSENVTLVEELRKNAVLISEDGQTLVYATMDEECIMSTISSLDQIESSNMRPMATIDPPLMIELQTPGVGGTDVTASHENPPLYSVNTISCNQFDYGPDTDGDGICDGWEDGSGLRIPYPAGGTKYLINNACGPCPTSTVPDIYVEIDYIDNTGNGCSDPQYQVNYRPSDLAISNIISAFNNYNFKLRIQLGEDVGGTTCRQTFNVWGDTDAGTNSFDEMKKTYFGFPTPDSERLTTDRGKAKYQVFHYGIFGSRQAGAAGSSGVAEPVGNDFVVTLGNPTFQYNSIDQQQGTLMHELGHNLGLHHGGPDDGVNDHTVNCKPNYPSVMSYIRQFTNTYDNATLRYSDDNFQTDQTPNRRISSQNPSETDVLKLTQSSAINSVEMVWGILVGGSWVAVDNDLEVGDPVVKADVSKSWSDIDWNHDDVINPDPAPNPPGDYIIKLGITGCTTGDDGWIYGADDWANLKLDFRHLNPTTFTSGFGYPESYPEEITNVTMKEIRLAGIQYLNYSLSVLDDQDFRNPNNSSTIKNDFYDRLLVDASSASALVNANDLDQAIDKLLGIRKQMDGTAGGDKTDDLLIFGSEKAVDFSRSVLPIPPEPGSNTAALLGSAAVTTLIITDADESHSSGTQDSFDFMFEDDAISNEPSFRVEIDGQGSENDEVISSFADYSGSVLQDILPGLTNMTLSETGGITGIFDEELEFEFGSLSLAEWQGLKIVITYIDANGSETEAGISFTGDDGILDVTIERSDGTVGDPPDGVSNGDHITITVQDGDLNLHDDDIQEFDSAVGTNGTFLISVETEDDHIAGTTDETVRETDANTGIFSVTFEVGQDIPIVANGSRATEIVVTYNDEVSFNGTAGEVQQVIIPIVGDTGAIAAPQRVGPATVITVLVTDADLNQDSESIDEYVPTQPNTNNFFVNFRTDRSEVGEASPSLEETGRNTGAFSFTLNLVTDEQACENDDLSGDPDLAATGGSDPSVGVCPGDLISISYEDDEIGGNSTLAVVSRVIEVIGWHPEFASDKNSYEVGDRVVVRIKDPDANRNMDLADSLVGIGVNSTSDSQGETFSAIETGPNTDLFRFAFSTTASSEAGRITVDAGDDVMIWYNDKFPADFAEENDDKDFTLNIAIEDGGMIHGGGGLDEADGSEPGYKQIESLYRVKNVLRILDNNIASLKAAMNLPFQQNDPFEITSYDVDCNKDDEACTIKGYSDSVTSVGGTFLVNSTTGEMEWDLIGQGRVELHVPTELAADVSEIRSMTNGRSFTLTSERVGNTTVVVIEDLNYYPRLLEVEYEPYDFPIDVSDPDVIPCLSIAPCVDDGEINTSDNLIVMTTIRNELDISLPCIAITDIRNPQGVTVALHWQACTTGTGGTIGPNDSVVISTVLNVAEPGEYSLVTVVVEELKDGKLLGLDRFELPTVI